MDTPISLAFGARLSGFISTGRREMGLGMFFIDVSIGIDKYHTSTAIRTSPLNAVILSLGLRWSQQIAQLPFVGRAL